MSGSFLSAAPMPAFTSLNRIRVMRLYRRALKLQMSWTPHYDIFRSQALEIRRRFEQNKNISDPRVLAKLIEDAEQELYENRHPDPYIPPTAPGGSKWERNIPPDRLKPPNIARDFNKFQTWHVDQRPYWQVMLATPGRIFEYCKDWLFPKVELTDIQYQKALAQHHRKEMDKRNARVEAIIQKLNLPASEAPARRRWERVIDDSKREINEWDWDAQYGDLEDSGDRQALYLAIFETLTKEPRLRRERFHREAIERAKKVDKNLPPVEKREFLAKEVAIAAAHGHIGENHYTEISKEIDGETLIARDKLFKALVMDFFIPQLEKFKQVISARDDSSVVEQTRFYWQPKEQLLQKIDELLALCRLERKFQPEERAEWIYELYMAPKLYTEMERRPGAALEYVYWTQGPECCPKGYKSPDETMWEMKEEIDREAQKKLGELRAEAFYALGKPDVDRVKTVDM